MKLKHVNIELLAVVSVVCTTAMVVYGSANLVLGFNADEFQLWQLLTAHFVHYDWQHVGTNMLALGLLLLIYPQPKRDVIMAFVIAIILIDLYLYSSMVKYYVGFSGLNYALIGMACFNLIESKKYIVAVLTSVCLMLYVLMFAGEQHLDNGIIWQPLKQAHVLGFVAGLVAKLIVYRQNNNSKGYETANQDDC